jgi:tRNA pseudouridine13 synthase
MTPEAGSVVDALMAELDRVPFITALIPAIDGKLRSTPEDFEVEEIPAYLPSGTGEHLYLWIEKRETNTPDAAKALARALNIGSDSAGWAGLKDRHAITRQWLSFHHAQTPKAEDFEIEGVRVLTTSRHENKLRTGHLHGNRFTLRLRDVPLEHDNHLRAALAELERVGMPSYFGAQRFGHGGNNLRHAFRWIVEQGKAPSTPFLRKLNVSVLQSALFNLWLGSRIAEGTLASAVLGDVMRKEETGGMFVSESVEIDGPRVTNWEISPTGPMFGVSMREAASEASAFESSLLARWGITEAQLARVKKYGEGTRRVGRVRPSNVKVDRDGGDVWLRFDLPKGAYATVLVGELMKRRAPEISDTES